MARALCTRWCIFIFLTSRAACMENFVIPLSKNIVLRGYCGNCKMLIEFPWVQYVSSNLDSLHGRIGYRIENKEYIYKYHGKNLQDRIE